MSETKEEFKPIDEEFHENQKQLLLDLVKDFRPDLGPKKLCQFVASFERKATKIVNHTIESFNRNGEPMVDKMLDQIKAIKMSYSDNEVVNKTISETTNNIIEKQKRINLTNESIVEKTVDLNELKSEESRLQDINQLMGNQKESLDSSVDVIKNLLKKD